MEQSLNILNNRLKGMVPWVLDILRELACNSYSYLVRKKALKEYVFRVKQLNLPVVDIRKCVCGLRFVYLKNEKRCKFCENPGLERPKKPENKVLRDEMSRFYKNSEWMKRKDLFGNSCACCRKHESTVEMHIDHIIPISKGGTNEIKNFQPLCRDCNLRKKVGVIFYPFDIFSCTSKI